MALQARLALSGKFGFTRACWAARVHWALILPHYADNSAEDLITTTTRDFINRKAQGSHKKIESAILVWQGVPQGSLLSVDTVVGEEDNAGEISTTDCSHSFHIISIIFTWA
ncbi:hypothetical protein J6590_068929 [Homalodisca vitripennis]|nr:hypothetical protein J6590_068929 [Homalodisca vitripennis]